MLLPDRQSSNQLAEKKYGEDESFQICILLSYFTCMILCITRAFWERFQNIPYKFDTIVRSFEQATTTTFKSWTESLRRQGQSLRKHPCVLYTFSHFLSISMPKSKRGCVTIHETILSLMKHRDPPFPSESFRIVARRTFERLLATWISISGNINDRISIKGWK